MFPGRQAFEAWKKATRRPRTAIQVLVACVVRQVFCTGPDLWGSFGRAPGLGTPASSMHPGRACTLVRPHSAHPSRAFPATWWARPRAPRRAALPAAGAVRRDLGLRLRALAFRASRELCASRTPRLGDSPGVPRPPFPAARGPFSAPRRGVPADPRSQLPASNARGGPGDDATPAHSPRGAVGASHTETLARRAGEPPRAASATDPRGPAVCLAGGHARAKVGTEANIFAHFWPAPRARSS